MHFEHTFQARLLELLKGGGGAGEGEGADGQAEALLGLPMPKGTGPGAPPTHHVYSPGHPHHLQAHQAPPPPPAEGAAYRQRPVRITLVEDRLKVEEDSVALSKAKPPPVLEATFGEVGGWVAGLGRKEGRSLSINRSTG